MQRAPASKPRQQHTRPHSARDAARRRCFLLLRPATASGILPPPPPRLVEAKTTAGSLCRNHILIEEGNGGSNRPRKREAMLT